MKDFWKSAHETLDFFFTNKLGFGEDAANLYTLLVLLLGISLICYGIWWILRMYLIFQIRTIARKTKTYWDDALVKAKFFRRLTFLIPILIFDISYEEIFIEYPSAFTVLSRIVNSLVVVALSSSVLSILKAARLVLERKYYLKDKPLISYEQLLRIFVFIVTAILLFSLIFGKSPMFFLSAFGAVSAVVLLIFKDSILGFVASIQLSANDMVRIGDWVTMEKYGADGDVFEINLATIKIRNFDRTISTIPTYSFISDSFKNWRGMAESEGRRIKRAIHIDLNTVTFCTPEMVERFKKIQLISSYIERRSEEIDTHNKSTGADKSELVNGRHMTNIGVFRKYIERYLENNPYINTEMTYMVRQLEPGANGIPLEIYCFSKDKNWVNYERIMADIFDHIISAAQRFDLKIFQNPTGNDFRNLRS
ncbi:MAG: mechanosensitive ion channel family protein [Flavobacteriales bacterium]